MTTNHADDFVDAALRVIVREGAAGLSYRGVALEAGWSVGAMQKAFPRKTDLLLAVLRRIVEASAAGLHLERGRPSARAWLVAVFMSAMPLDEPRTNFVRIASAIAEVAPFDPELAAAMISHEREYRVLLEKFLDDVAATGEIPAGLDHQRIVRILFCLSGGMQTRQLYEPLPAAEVEAMVCDTVHALLGPG